MTSRWRPKFSLLRSIWWAVIAGSSFTALLAVVVSVLAVVDGSVPPGLLLGLALALTVTVLACTAWVRGQFERLRSGQARRDRVIRELAEELRTVGETLSASSAIEPPHAGTPPRSESGVIEEPDATIIEGSACGAGTLEVLPGSHAEDLARRVPGSAEIWERYPEAPASFLSRLCEISRQGALLPDHGMTHSIWEYNSKVGGYELARACDVAHPLTYVDETEFAELDWTTLPDRFVAKPVRGSTGRGVMLLERFGAGRYHEHRSGTELEPDQIIDQWRKLHDAGSISSRVVIEEFVAPRRELGGTISIPDDWKVYCFFDRPVMVMQRRADGARSPRDLRFRFWSVDWDDLGQVSVSHRVDPTLEPPSLGPELIRAARRIGQHLEVPFCRIDLYETDRGVILGEITPRPGGPQTFRPDLDELLGREWELAETRLLAEGKIQQMIRSRA